MNADQRKIVVHALYGLSALLLFVFWRLGTQYDYTTSLLILQLSESPGPSYGAPPANFGVRLRMGTVGVICGLILPFVLGSIGAFLSKGSLSTRTPEGEESRGRAPISNVERTAVEKQFRSAGVAAEKSRGGRKGLEATNRSERHVPNVMVKADRSPGVGYSIGRFMGWSTTGRRKWVLLGAALVAGTEYSHYSRTKADHWALEHLVRDDLGAR